MYQTRFGPAYTPLALRRLIWTLIGTSLITALLDPVFRNSFGWMGPQEFFSLSLKGISYGMLWQPITYVFVLQPFGSLSLFFFIQLFFTAYILWALGGSVIQLIGVQPYFRMLVASAVTGAICGLFGMLIAGFDYYLAGPTPIIFATLIIWVMLNPEAEMLLFFTVPVLARWLVAGMIGMSMLISLSQGHWAALFYYLGSCSAAYLYATLAWELRSPFPATAAADRALANYGRDFRGKWHERQQQDVAEQKGKIVDFRTGKTVLRDDAFMDAMLEKISKFGEKSLSWRERWRMHNISKRKRGNSD